MQTLSGPLQWTEGTLQLGWPEGREFEPNSKYSRDQWEFRAKDSEGQRMENDQEELAAVRGVLAQPT